MLWGELTEDREDGYPRKYYELTIGKSLTFYVSFYGFLGTIHNARQKEREKEGGKKKRGDSGKEKREDYRNYRMRQRCARKFCF
jgi:predicted transcriptional regulator